MELMCPICMNISNANEVVYLHSNSSHYHCVACFKQLILSKITETDMNEFKCSIASCNHFITLDTIKDVFKDEYESLLIKNNTYQVAKDTNLVFCPKVNCGKVINTQGKQIIECQCGYIFHTLCKGEYKKGHNCNQIKGDLFKQLGNEAASIYKCPQCKYILVKDQGCNHMTCPFCKHQWCYICGATYNNSHYSGLLRCYSHFKYIRLSAFILIHIIAFLLFPLSGLVLCFVASALIIKAILKGCTGNHTIIVILLGIGLVLLSFILIPIAYGIFIIPFFIIVGIRIVIFVHRAIRKKRLYFI